MYVCVPEYPLTTSYSYGRYFYDNIGSVVLSRAINFEKCRIPSSIISRAHVIDGNIVSIRNQLLTLDLKYNTYQSSFSFIL